MVVAGKEQLESWTGTESTMEAGTHAHACRGQPHDPSDGIGEDESEEERLTAAHQDLVGAILVAQLGSLAFPGLELDCNLLLVKQVGALEDDAEAALADLLADAVVDADHVGRGAAARHGARGLLGGEDTRWGALAMWECNGAAKWRRNRWRRRVLGAVPGGQHESESVTGSLAAGDSGQAPGGRRQLAGSQRAGQEWRWVCVGE